MIFEFIFSLLSPLLIFFGGTVFGIVLLLVYGAIRGTQSDGWDDSNLTNWIRVFIHLILHPEDFGKMYYLTDEQYVMGTRLWGPIQQPFWYIPKDELSEVVRSRPDER